MLRKIGFYLLCAAASISTNAYSTINNTFQPGMTVEYELVSNEPQVFVNYMFWEIEANCKVTTEDQADELFVEALAKQGKVNEVVLTKGNSLRVTVHQGENLKISAESGAKVRITNLGQHTVKVTCIA